MRAWLLAHSSDCLPRLTTKRKKRGFSGLAKAIGVFFSGYAVAKLDPLVVWLTAPDRLASNHLLVARILIFVAALSTAVVNMYVYRIYVDPEEAGVRKPIRARFGKRL